MAWQFKLAGRSAFSAVCGGSREKVWPDTQPIVFDQVECLCGYCQADAVIPGWRFDGLVAAFGWS
jgi:hypothetical protein